jgi:hypothetical protein
MSQFYTEVIVRRAIQRQALARRISGETVADAEIGYCQSPLTKVQRRALAAQTRAQGEAPCVGWTGRVANVATGVTVLDATIVAQAKAEAKVRRAAWSDLQAVAAAQVALAI